MATSVTLAPAEASSFTNEAVAESVIKSTIRSNRAAIKSWLNSEATTNLRLEYNGVNNIG
ncbi:RNase A-like domain-containing protein [Chryseobacterium sp. CKR4-1]|uniref:RNase A-like domain-containing protein n=1 Tax=Chryseobacterium sp. CKR4-1 TaxID=3068896 RepID=UPI00358FF503